MSARIAIACGGTGGHFFPGIAVAGELRAMGHEVMLLLSNKQVDRQAMEPYKDYLSEYLPAMGWPGLASPKTPLFIFRLAQTRWQCGRLFKKWVPDAVLGMGGFVSAVPLMVGRRMGVPTLIHESNTLPGKVTRAMAMRVSRVLLGFGVCAEHLPGEARKTVTGTPVRPELGRVSREEACAKFGLDPQRKTLLVMGGSQGAKALNEATIKSMSFWEGQSRHWQFIHLTGSDDLALVETNYRRARLRARVMDFCPDMASVYAASDMAISRSGASSITELVTCLIPSVLVPYPAAAENHQHSNACVMVEAGAAVLVEQDKIKPELFALQVEQILNSTEKMSAMRKGCRSVSCQESACKVAAAVLEEMRK